jgi:hypothetical protein
MCESIKTEGKYILKGNKPVPCYDLLEWAEWFEKADRHIGQFKYRGVFISTVFLGLDHNFLRSGDPILWESMVFYKGKEQLQFRYDSYQSARFHHFMILSKEIVKINRFRKLRKPKAKR